METLVLIKPVPEGETRLRPTASGTDLDPEGIKWVLAGYDESAVEQALLLKESAPGSHVRAMSFGPSPRSEEILRSAIALGCDFATCIEAPPDLEVDPLLTARVLAFAARKYPFDLLLTGKQAGDDEAGIVAGALGGLLDLPCFGGVADLRWKDSTKSFGFQRILDLSIDQWEAPAPCVIALQQAWNDPRTAKLPNILKSRKAPIERIPWSELTVGVPESTDPGTGRVQFRLPAPRTGARMIEFKTPEEAAQKLVVLLKEEAKVFP